MRGVNGLFVIGGTVAVIVAYCLAERLKHSEIERRRTAEQNAELSRQLANSQARLAQAEAEKQNLSRRLETRTA